MPKRILHQLQRVGQHATTSQQHDALKNSRIILYFIMGRNESGEFTHYFNNFHTAHPSSVCSFDTKEEADTWLFNHPAPPHGATIEAANTHYTLAYSRDLNHRKLLRHLSDEELALSEETEEDTEDSAGEEPPLPEPGPGTQLVLFDFFLWTSFHLYAMEKRISDPEEIEAIRAAKIAFEFVMHQGEAHGFAEYWQTLRTSSSSPPRQSFRTWEEANGWLALQPEPPHPEVVAIGSEFFSVGYDRLRRLRVLIRLPTQQELDGEDG